MVDQRLLAEMADRATLYRALVDRFGSGVLDVVAQWTIDGARSRMEHADLERRDLQAVMEQLWDQMGDDTAFEILERTDSTLKLSVSKCLFAEEMRRLGAAEIGKAFYCAYDEGFCQGLNPNLRFTRTKTLMNGDDSCNHTYELRENAERA